ncbi:MAG: hypothetical protein ABI414_13410, partial [Devosia sp.]
MRLLRRIVTGLAVLIVLGYAAVVGGMYYFQRDLQYEKTGPITALADTAIVGAENVAIPVDGSVVNGWYEAPKAGKPLIVYYKGNAGSFTREHERYAAWTQAGYGFLAFDYRGYPASPGSISQQGILDDAVAAFDWVAAKGFPVVIWGRSLGSGPSTYVASVRDADALLLETPFLSAVNVAAERYPYLPVYWVMQDQFPVAVDVFVRGLRAGHPIAAALELLTVEMPDPIGSQFGIVVDEITYGAELRDTLQAMADRWGLDDMRM